MHWNGITLAQHQRIQLNRTEQQRPTTLWARMVEILRFEESPDKTKVTPKLEFEGLQRIIKDPRCENLEFFLMSLTGRKRNGKSFLTNLLISKFGFQAKNRDRNRSWIESNETVKGVEWKRDRDSVTKGIWVWSQPLIVTTKGGQKVAVILLDCQGLYDPAPHQETVDAMITLYSLELSKVQIFNSKGDIDAADLQHLESSISFAGMSGLSLMFNTLVLLHRDWETDQLYGSRGSYFENMNAQRGLNRCEQVVKDAFDETVEYTMPTPGSNIRRANVGDKVKLQELRKQKESAAFLNWVDQFGDFIMEEYVTKPKRLCSRGQLLILIERINSHIKDESSHYTFQSPAEVLERRLILSFFEELEDAILPSTAEEIQVKSYKSNQEDKMLQDIQQAENTVKEHFRQKQKEHQTHTELGLKTWKEVNVKVEKWFAALRELKLLEFKHMLDKKKMRALIMGLSIASTAALGAATGGIALAAAAPVLAIEVGAGTIAAVAAAGGAAGLAISGTGVGIGVGVENIRQRLKDRLNTKLQEKKRK